MVIFISACTSAMSNSTATVNLQQPTMDAQRVMEMTRDYSVVQTIVALEQLTITPSPETLSNLPKPWILIRSLTPAQTSTLAPTATPHSAIATALKPRTPLREGPGIDYNFVCIVDQGTQLLIVGRNSNSSYFRVTFGQGQPCYVLDANSNRTNIIPVPSLQFWISYLLCTISGDLTEVAINTPLPTPYDQDNISTPTGTPTEPKSPSTTPTPTPTNTPIPPTNTPIPPLPTDTPITPSP